MTGIVSNLSVEVDGVPRHIADERGVVNGDGDFSSADEEEEVSKDVTTNACDEEMENSQAPVAEAQGRPKRQVRLFPRSLDGFEVG